MFCLLCKLKLYGFILRLIISVLTNNNSFFATGTIIVIQPFYNSCENYLNDATVNATCYLFKINAEEKLRKIDNAKKDVSEMLEADNSRMYEYVKKAKEVKLLTDSLNDVEGYDVYKKRNTVEKRYNEINETTENISSLAVVGTLNMER